MRDRTKTLSVGLIALSILAACGEQEVILPGERLDLRDGLVGADVAPEQNQTLPVALPAAVLNTSWTHRGGDADHRIAHPALGQALTLAFAVDIGEGNSRRLRITADPVVGPEAIFTLDASSVVTAVSPSGAVLWQTDVTPVNDARDEASGGGLALADSVLIVSTGFGRVVAIERASGAQLWVQDLNAPGNAAPTVHDGRVYVVARDGRGWALDLETGRVAWTLTATPNGANVAGGSGVAVTGDIAIFPFPSGEVYATFPEGGFQRWSSVIAGERPGEAAAVAASDISADPVIVGDRVYVGNVSGRVVAMALANGDRLWTATEGATSPVSVVGDAVFLVNDLNQIVRLSATDGSVVWRVQMPVQEEPRWRWQRSVPRHAHYGPVLAGGRLIVASSDGVLRQFDPASGAELDSVALPEGAASHPAVAGNTLYVVNQDGQLLAYR